MMPRLKVGLRTIKTGIAVAVALGISWYVVGIYSGIGAVAAIVAMQPTIHRSFKMVINRILGTILGLVCGLMVVAALGANPLTIGLAVIVALAFNTLIGKTDMSTFAGFAIVLMFESPTNDYVHYALTRSLLTVIGVLSAVAVNYVFFPPHYEERLMLLVKKTTERLMQDWRSLIKDDAALLEVRKQVLKHEEMVLMLQEDEKYPLVASGQSEAFIDLRRLVALEDKLLLLLESLASHREEALSPERQREFEQEIDFLLAHHYDVIYSKNRGGSLFDLQHEEQPVAEIIQGHLLDYREQLEKMK
ncbi:FUSC family protein [Exiguobacterium flavidum]|uniref:FUSC family protein n=1 Tax=Exiguobacterium flavidum TaxID=2184695 RepID=UPI000DF7EE9A|nr:aromatic acid exporter family protein [Exiguobacterium flavidum]